MRFRLKLVSWLGVAGLAIAGSGCVVAAPGVAVGVGPPVEIGYQPLLYDGYVVYYTPIGLPYYWADGYQVWLPAAARTRYVTYWRIHRPAYERWQRDYGQRYRTRRYQPQGAPALRPEHRQKPTLTPKRSHRKGER